MTDRGVETVSSEQLAASAGVNSAKVRKDLSYLGSYGTRGVGYDIAYLIFQIERELGLTQEWNCAIVGLGNLGRALANYKGFGERGFRIVALFDIDKGKIGHKVNEHVVDDFGDVDRIVKERSVSIGVIATTATAAQDACDTLVSAGVKSILNFAPTVLQVPDDVSLRKVDLSIELQILSFYEQRKSALDSVRRGKRLTASASKSTRP